MLAYFAKMMCPGQLYLSLKGDMCSPDETILVCPVPGRSSSKIYSNSFWLASALVAVVAAIYDFTESMFVMKVL